MRFCWLVLDTYNEPLTFPHNLSETRSTYTMDFYLTQEILLLLFRKSSPKETATAVAQHYRNYHTVVFCMNVNTKLTNSAQKICLVHPGSVVNVRNCPNKQVSQFLSELTAKINLLYTVIKSLIKQNFSRKICGIHCLPGSYQMEEKDGRLKIKAVSFYPTSHPLSRWYFCHAMTTVVNGIYCRLSKKSKCGHR